MCEFSGRLVAWLDRELSAADAAEVERHLGECAGCRKDIAAYENAGAAFDAHCEVLVARSARRRMPRWVLTVSGGAAASIAAAVLFVVWYSHAPASSLPAPAVISAAPVEPAASQAAVPHVRGAVTARRTRLRPLTLPEAKPTAAARPDAAAWFASEPAVEIAIPADAVFAPGAVPPGVSLNAELTIGTDGSVQWILLRP